VALPHAVIGALSERKCSKARLPAAPAQECSETVAEGRGISMLRSFFLPLFTQRLGETVRKYQKGATADSQGSSAGLRKQRRLSVCPPFVSRERGYLRCSNDFFRQFLEGTFSEVHQESFKTTHLGNRTGESPSLRRTR